MNHQFNLRRIALFPLLCCLWLSLLSQWSSDPQVTKLGQEAIAAMDAGKPDEALALLGKALELDPGNTNILYEMAFAHQMKKEYDKAMELLEGIISKKPDPMSYQLLGNVQDLSGQPDKAIETYDKGISLFPEVGNLYLEKGVVMAMRKEDLLGALDVWEAGIKADPEYPSNYYWACKVYCASNAKVWGLLYGEMFMNMERNSRRTAEISSLLFKTYQESVELRGKGEIAVSLNKVNTLEIPPGGDPASVKLPFPMVFEMQMIIAVATVSPSLPKKAKALDLEAICNWRSAFLQMWFESDNAKTYPNHLFNFQASIKDKGHLDAYNHWLLMKGDEEAFEEWDKTHSEEFKKFANWFNKNPLTVDREHHIHSSQY